MVANKYQQVNLPCQSHSVFAPGYLCIGFFEPVAVHHLGVIDIRLVRVIGAAFC